MDDGLKKFRMNHRRGVSQIIGSLIVLALVASIGSVILFQGLGQINNFTYDLEIFDVVKNDSLRERLDIQHVAFTPGAGNDLVTIWVGNYGNVEATVQSITMVKVDDQELILAWQAPNGPDDSTIQIDTIAEFDMDPPGLDCPVGCTFPEWDDDYYEFSLYEIRITTSRGTFVEPYAVEPWDG